jgi:hypothetical protein
MSAASSVSNTFWKKGTKIIVISAIVNKEDCDGNNCWAKSIEIKEYKIAMPKTWEGLSSAFFGLSIDSSISFLWLKEVDKFYGLVGKAFIIFYC